MIERKEDISRLMEEIDEMRDRLDTIRVVLASQNEAPQLRQVLAIADVYLADITNRVLPSMLKDAKP